MEQVNISYADKGVTIINTNHLFRGKRLYIESADTIEKTQELLRHLNKFLEGDYGNNNNQSNR